MADIEQLRDVTPNPASAWLNLNVKQPINFSVFCIPVTYIHIDNLEYQNSYITNMRMDWFSAVCNLLITGY